MCFCKIVFLYCTFASSSFLSELWSETQVTCSRTYWRVLPSSVAMPWALSFTWQTLVANVHLFNRLASRIILLLQVYLALLSKQLALFFPQDKLDFQT